MVKRPALLCALLVASSGNACADDLEWHGFLNIVGGVLQYEPYDSVTHPQGARPGRPGYTHHPTFDEDTSAGLQARKPINDQDAITAQLFARGGDDHYAAKMKWLYFSHDDHAHSLWRVGRIGAPIYYYSDFLNVGYAYPWTIPPRETYTLDPTMTGIDYTWRDTAGAVDWSAEVFVASANQYLPPVHANTRTRNMRGLVMTLTLADGTNVRASGMRQTFSLDFDTLTVDGAIDQGFAGAVEQHLISQAQADALEPLFKPGMRPLIEEALTIQDDPMTYTQLSVHKETPRWLAMAEYTNFHTDTYLYNITRSWLVTAGIRTGNTLWHLTRSLRDQPASSDVQQDAATRAFLFSTPLAQMTNEQKAQLPTMFARTIRVTPALEATTPMDAWTVGASIDVSPKMKIKNELIFIRTHATAAGEIYDVGRNTLFRTALNVTF